MSMDVTARRERDIVVLQLDGRLDAASSPIIERKIDAFIDAGQSKFILNFEQVDYLSSAGMRLLLSIGKKLEEKQGKMVVASISNGVMEILKMAGFERILTICHTEREALGEFD